MTHTCDEICFGKQEGGRVEVGIESPVVYGKQPVRLPPAARGEFGKDVPYYAVSHRVARKEYTSKYGVKRECSCSSREHERTRNDSVGESSSTHMYGIILSRGNKSSQKASRWPLLKRCRKIEVVCEGGTPMVLPAYP